MASALKVEVLRDFNSWSGSSHQLYVRWDGSGIWEDFILELGHGDLYKYRIYSNSDQKVREKADPYARCNEIPPRSASIVWKTDYKWKDNKWQEEVAEKNKLDSPMTTLVCPVIEENARTKRVYIPKSEWNHMCGLIKNISEVKNMTFLLL